jgi:large subunit ribosomal protein L24
MLGVKRGDMVKVVAGRSRGQTGKVLSVDREKGRIVVEHVQMTKKHLRANPSKNIKGGIAEREAPISLSNVMLLCPTCGPVRPKTEVLPKGNKPRARRRCGKCGNTFE